MGLDRVIAVRNTKTIYRDGKKCIKVFSKAYTKAKVMSEALNHAVVEQTNLDIPKLIEVTFVNDKYAIISEFIKGNQLSDLMEKSETGFDRYLDLFSSLQIQIHAYKDLVLENQFDRFVRKLDRFKIDENTKSNMIDKLNNITKEYYLCHGDFNPTNIIICDNGKPYILDWSDASIGNRQADVAKSYLWFYYRYNLDDAEKYLSRYCLKSNIDEQSTREWIPIVAALQSVDATESEKTFLLSIVNKINNN